MLVNAINELVNVTDELVNITDLLVHVIAMFKLLFQMQRIKLCLRPQGIRFIRKTDEKAKSAAFGEKKTLQFWMKNGRT